MIQKRKEVFLLAIVQRVSYQHEVMRKARQNNGLGLEMSRSFYQAFKVNHVVTSASNN